MSDANFLLLATRSRTRAKEILARPEAVTDADARQEMRETAAACEDLVAQLEKELVGMGRRPRARSDFEVCGRP